MRIEIDVASYYDWELRSEADVKPGEVAVLSHHGSQFRLVQVHKEKPSITYIDVPDQDLQRMVEEHEEAVKNARQGYETIQVGGPNDGQVVTVPPRNASLKSAAKLLAEHLGQTVMPYHAPDKSITKVRIITSNLSDAEQKKLEKYLNRTLTSAGEEVEGLGEGLKGEEA